MAHSPDPGDSSWAYLAPIDLREHDLPVQAALGFHRGHTEMLLSRAADTIERLNRELAEIRSEGGLWKLERSRLDAEFEEEKTRAERLVGEAMVDAHKAISAIRAEAQAEAEVRRAEAEALLEPARQEAERLVAEARAEANQRLADAETECERLAVRAEHYRLLAADVHRSSAEVLRRALEALEEPPGEAHLEGRIDESGLASHEAEPPPVRSTASSRDPRVRPAIP